MKIRLFILLISIVTPAQNIITKELPPCTLVICISCGKKLTSQEIQFNLVLQKTAPFFCKKCFISMRGKEEKELVAIEKSKASTALALFSHDSDPFYENPETRKLVNELSMQYEAESAAKRKRRRDWLTSLLKVREIFKKTQTENELFITKLMALKKEVSSHTKSHPSTSPSFHRENLMERKIYSKFTADSDVKPSLAPEEAASIAEQNIIHLLDQYKELPYSKGSVVVPEKKPETSEEANKTMIGLFECLYSKAVSSTTPQFHSPYVQGDSSQSLDVISIQSLLKKGATSAEVVFSDGQHQHITLDTTTPFLWNKGKVLFYAFENLLIINDLEKDRIDIFNAPIVPETVLEQKCTEWGFKKNTATTKNESELLERFVTDYDYEDEA